jgi:hypothetical protein
VVDDFHWAKGELIAWLQENRAAIPQDAFDIMEHEVKETRIQKPPATEEPDLAFRGIGVWTQKGKEDPLVRLGGGFIPFASHQHESARFEILRLVAQSISPCELKRLGVADDVWKPLLTCLNVNEPLACMDGTFSESAWAVSTTLAAQKAKPACHITAFDDDRAAACLKKIPVGRQVASIQENHQ